ncbi:MAG TPA: class I SAM-dependent methyltransferase [Gaiellaceae bacterium]|nr:class I SAM-dependent methyltransferase [Gaiellaceae bacterium]
MSLTAELKASPPTLHGEAEFWGLAWEALAFIERAVQPGMATLETGAGASTIVFAARGASHETITPSAAEAERITAECERRGISTENLTFRIGSSADVLRSWDPRPLDFVLVDGAHAFPYPALDWWFLAPHLKIGGLMLLDDAYMPPVAAVVEHLRDSSAWRLEAPASFRTAVARKLAEEVPEGEWKGRRMSFAYLPPKRRAVAAVRQRVFSTRLGLKALELARPLIGRVSDNGRG